MSAPLLWIVLPMIVAGISFFLRRWKMVVSTTIAILALLWAFLAWLIPIGDLFLIGPWAFTVSDRVIFAGRLFLLSNADRPLLIVIYLFLAFFIFGSIPARMSKMFVPIGLGLTATLIASLAVEPFLYAPLFIQIAVLLSVFLLSPPGKKVERGLLRYLTLMTFSLPFMLTGGWLLSEVDPAATDPATLYPVLVFLGLGFAFLLAIFPLNSWIPMLAERINPYALAFLLSILPLTVITLLLRFTGSFPWLLELEIIQFLGIIMVLTGGVWVIFQRDLGRILGYAFIIEIGRSILAVSHPDGLSIYVFMFLPRILAFAVWSLALSLIRNRVENLNFRSVQGFGRQFPLLVLGVLTAQFSLAGFPLLAGFPVLLLLLDQIAQASAALALFTLLGSFGLLASGLRSLAVFVMGPEELPDKENPMNRISQIYLLFGLIAIVFVGLFPHWFSAIFANIVEVGSGQ